MLLSATSVQISWLWFAHFAHGPLLAGPWHICFFPFHPGGIKEAADVRGDRAQETSQTSLRSLSTDYAYMTQSDLRGLENLAYFIWPLCFKEYMGITEHRIGPSLFCCISSGICFSDAYGNQHRPGNKHVSYRGTYWKVKPQQWKIC